MSAIHINTKQIQIGINKQIIHHL